MAIKKNTDENLNIIKKDGITDSYEKKGFFKGENQPNQSKRGKPKW